MKTLSLIQGSPEWHAHRAKSRNASDAAAMLGLCKYKTRSQLLQEKATGIVEEVTPEMQRLFDKGHAAEAAARAIAEEIIGEELFPCTATDDACYLSASFDGIDISSDTIWEHKLANAALIDSINAGVVPDTHWSQLEQGLLVSGASRVLVMSSDGTRTNLAYMFYESVPERRSQLIDGWKQFDEDLKTYEYVAPKVVAVAEATDSLPTVSVRLDGQIAIVSNLPEFGIALRSFIERIPSSPSTDQDFANCEGACKALKKAEDALEASEAHALAQIVDVEAMRRMVADLRNLARSTRLASEKLVTARKESLRVEILTGGKTALEAHIQQINQTLGERYQLPAIATDFAGAIKGKRTLSSMQDAVDTALANAKIEANRVADNIRINVEMIRTEALGYAALFPDAHVLALKANDDLKAVISSRIGEHKAAEAKKEAEQRERIRLEEESKAQKKLDDEREAIDRTAREEERKRNTEAMKQAKVDSKPKQDQENIPVWFGDKQVSIPDTGSTVIIPAERPTIEISFEQALEKWAQAHCITELALSHLYKILERCVTINETEPA